MARGLMETTDLHAVIVVITFVDSKFRKYPLNYDWLAWAPDKAGDSRVALLDITVPIC